MLYVKITSKVTFIFQCLLNMNTAVKSTFRWCVDDELLQKHNLISPEDYITDPALITRAPKGNF